MIRILLSDDHTQLRESLKMLLYTIVANASVDEAWDEDTVIEKIKGIEYHLIILDSTMHRTGSLELTGSIINIRPQANILILTMHPSPAQEKLYRAAGAKGYSGKTIFADFKCAIKALLN